MPALLHYRSYQGMFDDERTAKAKADKENSGPLQRRIFLVKWGLPLTSLIVSSAL